MFLNRMVSSLTSHPVTIFFWLPHVSCWLRHFFDRLVSELRADCYFELQSFFCSYVRRRTLAAVLALPSSCHLNHPFAIGICEWSGMKLCIDTFPVSLAIRSKSCFSLGSETTHELVLPYNFEPVHCRAERLIHQESF
ncbi:hypothetical protein K439DRAFT_1633156 [Ramaria rubella]|nr:hypothetical protein K439DRAFT_1633156 [Ramaria rubella]